jgi:hypothetical protein
VDQQNLTSTLFTLDDAVEDMQWKSINIRVSSAFEALNNAMGMLHDVITSADQVHVILLLGYLLLVFLCL